MTRLSDISTAYDVVTQFLEKEHFVTKTNTVQNCVTTLNPILERLLTSCQLTPVQVADLLNKRIVVVTPNRFIRVICTLFNKITFGRWKPNYRNELELISNLRSGLASVKNIKLIVQTGTIPNPPRPPPIKANTGTRRLVINRRNNPNAGPQAGAGANANPNANANQNRQSQLLYYNELQARIARIAQDLNVIPGATMNAAANGENNNSNT